MNVLLVGPEIEENLSLRYLSAALQAAGHRVTLARFDDPGDAPQVVKAARGVGLAGLSMCFQVRARHMLDLAATLRAEYGQLPIIAGGHFASCAAVDVMSRHPAIDLIGIGEGEATIVEVANGLDSGCFDPRGTRGLACRDRGQVLFTPPRPVISILDSIPDPDRSGPVRLVGGVPTATICGSRGCPHSCDYCSISTLYSLSPGERFRRRSTWSIAVEMARLYHERGIRQFIFHDDNALAGAEGATLERLDRLHEELGRHDVTDIALFLTTRPGTLTSPVLRKLMEMGLIRLFMGVESSTVEGYRSLGRQQSPAEVESAFELCRRVGVSVQYTVLVFHPEATVSSLRSDIAFMNRHMDHALNFVRAEAHAGTPLERRMAADGRLYGTYLGHSYTISDPAANLTAQFWTVLFRQRCGSDQGLMNNTIRLDHLTSVLRRFYSGAECATIVREAEVLRSAVNQSSLDLLARLVDICEGHPDGAGRSFARFMMELKADEARSASVLMERCSALTERVNRLTREQLGLLADGNAVRRTSLLGHSLARHVAAVSVAIQMVGAIWGVAATEMAEMPIDADNDALFDNLEKELFGTDGSSIDSDEDGITDDTEDHDGDGIPNIEEQKDIQRLVRAAWDGNLELVRYLLARGTDIDAQRGVDWNYDDYQDRCNALASAAHQGHTEIMQLLLSSGAAVNINPETGEPPIIAAAAGSTPAAATCVKLLINAGADVNVRNPVGRTPLIAAAREGMVETARLLLDAGADPSLEDLGGHDALFHARLHHNEEVVDLLQAAKTSR